MRMRRVADRHQSGPANGTSPTTRSHWSVRSDGAMPSGSLQEHGPAVVRSLFGVQPHRQSAPSRFPTIPFFVEKVRDIVRSLPESARPRPRALASMRRPRFKLFSELSPKLPMGLGYVEGFTHDYKRHGTTTLFAALDVATARVITKLSSAAPSSGVPRIPA